MTDKLRELNETYYELYGRLYENGEQLTKEQRDSIAAKLLAEYESEYEVLRLKAEIARAAVAEARAAAAKAEEIRAAEERKQE